jgi:hypothetical protein
LSRWILPKTEGKQGRAKNPERKEQLQTTNER